MSEGHDLPSDPTRSRPTNLSSKHLHDSPGSSCWLETSCRGVPKVGPDHLHVHSRAVDTWLCCRHARCCGWQWYGMFDV